MYVFSGNLNLLSSSAKVPFFLRKLNFFLRKIHLSSWKLFCSCGIFLVSCESYFFMYFICFFDNIILFHGEFCSMLQWWVLMKKKIENCWCFADSMMMAHWVWMKKVPPSLLPQWLCFFCDIMVTNISEKINYNFYLFCDSMVMAHGYEIRMKKVPQFL